MLTIERAVIVHLRPSVDRIARAIVAELQKELRDQTHIASGSLANTLNYKVTEDEQAGFLAVIYGNEYWRHVNDGVPSNRIPYNPRVRTGRKTSRYIQALIDWAAIVRPSLDEKERKSFVFAVAAKHAKEGMPTRGSYAFSRNGHRLDFVGRVISKININELIPKDTAEKVVSEILKAA